MKSGLYCLYNIIFSQQGNASVAECLYMYWLSIYLSTYISMSRRHLLTSFPQWLSDPLCNCLVEKVNHGTDVFTHKHIELPASSYICSQAHMYEINYIDRQ